MAGSQNTVKKNSAKEAILDKAEEVFANHGIEAYSLRKIAHFAEVDPPLITYHFGNKTALLEAVIERRVSVLTELRLQTLGEVLRRTKNRPSIEDVLHAAYDPLMKMFLSSDEGWRNYGRLLTRMSVMPSQTEIIEKYMAMTETHLTNAFRLALPHLSDEELFWGIALTVASGNMLFSRSARFTQLASHLDEFTVDFERGYEFFIQNSARAFRPRSD